jgi:tRNA 2-selenouridine synthase SelU
MKTLHELEMEANQRRVQFGKTLDEIKQRAQFPTIVHEAIGLLNLRRKGPPLIAAGAIAGSVWLFNKLRKHRKSPQKRVIKIQPLR